MKIQEYDGNLAEMRRKLVPKKYEGYIYDFLM